MVSFRYTLNGDYLDAASGTLNYYGGQTFAPDPTQTLNIAPGSAFLSVITTVNGGSSSQALDLRVNGGGVFLDWSDGTGAVMFRGMSLGDVLKGGSANDRLFGGGGDDKIDGGAGADYIVGGGGDDTLGGGDGNDTILAVGGSDLIDGGAGFDQLILFGKVTTDVEDGYALTLANGRYGATTYSGIEWITGSSFDDVIRGSAIAERLEGGAGDDVLEGRGGNDTLIGGEGADHFVFADTNAGMRIAVGRDTITDFSVTDNDYIDLTGMRRIQGFGSLTITQLGGDAVIEAPAGFRITLTGVDATTLSSDDFVFRSSHTATAGAHGGASDLLISQNHFLF